MKPSALFEALHALIGQRVPLHIWGACGVGKSQIVLRSLEISRYSFSMCAPYSSIRSICGAASNLRRPGRMGAA